MNDPNDPLSSLFITAPTQQAPVAQGPPQYPVLAYRPSLTPQDLASFIRPPLSYAPGPAPVQPAFPQVLDTEGSAARGVGASGQSEPFNFRTIYRKNVPF